MLEHLKHAVKLDFVNRIPVHLEMKIWETCKKKLTVAVVSVRNYDFQLEGKMQLRDQTRTLLQLS